VTDPLRHRRRHILDESAFGNDRFGRWAERFARFFGTPRFIICQTIIVAVWIIANGFLIAHVLQGHPFDPYPFILLNLLFSTQAAYAAPLILLAQTRQADRDKSSAEADAHHREEVAERQAALIQANTVLTQAVKADTELNREIHRHVTALCEHLGVEAGTFDPGQESA
jgi:uncharacterized membrane protein